MTRSVNGWGESALNFPWLHLSQLSNIQVGMLCSRSIKIWLNYEARKVQWLMFPAPPEGQLQTELFRALSKAPSPAVPLAMTCSRRHRTAQQGCRQHSPGCSCSGQAQHKAHIMATRQRSSSSPHRHQPGTCWPWGLSRRAAALQKAPWGHGWQPWGHGTRAWAAYRSLPACWSCNSVFQLKHADKWKGTTDGHFLRANTNSANVGAKLPSLQDQEVHFCTCSTFSFDQRLQNNEGKHRLISPASFIVIKVLTSMKAAQSQKHMV